MEAALQPHRGGTVLGLGVLVLVVLTSTGCSSERSTWTYALSREFYDSKNWEHPWSESSVPVKEGNGMAALGLAVLFLAPILIDTAILPITATHDLLASR